MNLAHHSARLFLLVAPIALTACGSGESTTPGGTDTDSGSADVLDTSAPDAPVDDTGSEVSAEDADGGEVVAPCAWTRFDDGLAGGTIATVAHEPRAGGAAFAIAGGSVYRAGSAGWERIGRSPSTISDLSFSPTVANDIYGASGLGMLRSTDGGKNWVVQGLGGVALTAALVHPAEAVRVYAGTLGSGLFRSLDGGATWSSAAIPSPQTHLTSLTAPSNSRDTVLAGFIALNTAGGWSDSGGIYRSTNGGGVWTSVFSGGRVHRITTCAATPTVMWAASSTGLAKSINGGADWTRVETSKYFVDVAVAGSSCNTLYATVYPTGVIRSDDGGATWSSTLESGLALQDGYRAPTRISVAPDNADRLIAATHGGLYESTNKGATFTPAGGIKNLQVNGFAPTSMELYLSAYGAGLWRRATDATTWSRATALSRDFITGVWASADGSTVFAAAFSPSGLWRSNDGAKTFTSVLATNVSSLIYHPTAATTMYAATQTLGVQRSTDGGVTWSPMNEGLTAWPTPAGTFIDVRAVVIDPSTPTRMLIGTNGRGFFRTTDGTSWSATASDFATVSVNRLVVSRTASTVYASIASSGVARSTDFGATWTYVNEGLPTLNLSLAEDETTGDVYALTSKGIFVLAPMTTKWTAVADECAPSTAYGTGSIMKRSGGRALVVAAGGTVYSRAL